MGKQTGAHPIDGSINGINYYRTAESGLLVRKKSSLNKERVDTDPAFEESRKANKEFGRASSGSHLIRATMKKGGGELGDNRAYNRLTGLLRGAMATDVLHPKGERSLVDADLSRLVGFEFNKYQTFSKLYSGKVKFSIDAASGLMEADTPGINAAQDFDAPSSATHVQLILEGAGIDFGLEEGVAVSDTTKWLSLKRKYAVQTLSGTIAVRPGMKLVLGMGIRFGQETNGVVYELKNRLYRAFVFGAVAGSV